MHQGYWLELIEEHLTAGDITIAAELADQAIYLALEGEVPATAQDTFTPVQFVRWLQRVVARAE